PREPKPLSARLSGHSARHDVFAIRLRVTPGESPTRRAKTGQHEKRIMPFRIARTVCGLFASVTAWHFGGPPLLRGRRGKSHKGSHHIRARRRSCALIATMTVLSDMSTAPIAAGSTMPHGANTPAASGIAKTL